MEIDFLTLVGKYYTIPEIVVLLAKAEEMGFGMEKDSWFE